MQNPYSLHMAVQLYSDYYAVYYSSIYTKISQVATYFRVFWLKFCVHFWSHALYMYIPTYSQLIT